MPNRLVNLAGVGSDFARWWKIYSKVRQMPDEIQLSAGDRAIMRALQQDCRLSNAQLAEKVGMSASACWRRVRALEEAGVIEGRRTFANMLKYIKMTASSNFGNVFSVLVASAFIPFLPMLPIHLLIQNLQHRVVDVFAFQKAVAFF